MRYQQSLPSISIVYRRQKSYSSNMIGTQLFTSLGLGPKEKVLFPQQHVIVFAQLRYVPSSSDINSHSYKFTPQPETYTCTNWYLM